MTFKEDEAYLDKIRDLFLISCFTGLRFGDVATLAPKHILQADRGLQIKKQSVKVDKVIELPLHGLFKVKGAKSRPEQLVQRYLDMHHEQYGKKRAFEKEPFFQKLTNQYVNRELKTIAERANIKKNVTCHVGRHTFATHLASKKVSPQILMELLQHSDIKTTMKYVHLSKKLIFEELDKTQW